MLSSYILKNCFCPNKLQDFDFRDLCSIFSRPTDGDKLMNLQMLTLDRSTDDTQQKTNRNRKTRK